MGFQETLGIDNQQYFNVLMMFCEWPRPIYLSTMLTTNPSPDVGYMVFELPALMLLRRFHAPTVYGVSIIIFGVCGLATAYAKNYAQAIVLRLFLGCGEATVQTSFMYISLWYRREEMNTRCGEFVRSDEPPGQRSPSY